MSFLFKSSKKSGSSSSNHASSNPSSTPNALPPATREIRSSDGPGSGSQIPTLNGAAKPGSPSQGATVGSLNSSLNSLAGNTEGGRSGSGNAAGSEAGMAGQQQGSRSGSRQEGNLSGGTGMVARMESPEQKSLRDRSQDSVSSIYTLLFHDGRNGGAS